MLVRDTSFVVIDVETTGLSAQANRITEVALLRVQNGAITETFESLINPQQYIPPFIAEYTGITNTMVFGKPTFAELSTDLSRFVKHYDPTVIVGHNVSFDHGFVAASYSRAGIELPYGPLAGSGVTPLVCTARLARMLLPNLKKRSLKHVADYFGIKIKARHRAMGDAEATAKVLIRFLDIAREEHEVEELEDLLRLQYRRSNGRSVVPKRQTKLRDQVRAFPERPGVYIMRDKLGEVLYVGKAKSLRDRVGSYFTASSQDANSKLSRMMRVVKEISYEETGSELSALLLESRKIKELKPRFNSLERRYRTYTFLRLDTQSSFPKLDAVREPASDGAEYYGPFRSYASVEALIDVLNRSFQLRECGSDFSVSPENKPCFYYDIKRCGAPCALLVSKDEYRKEVERLRQFLSTGEDGVLALVEQMMLDAADRLDFEEAQYLKLRLFELRRVLGEGERQVASLNANDAVIMTSVPEHKAEVFFVRYGRLAKQLTVDGSYIERAEDWFARQLRMYYSDAINAIPPVCGRPEVDEMRILSAWADRKKRQGSSVIYLTQEWEATVPKLARALKELIHSAPSKSASALLEEPLPASGGEPLPVKAPDPAPKAPEKVLQQRTRLVLRRMNSKK